MARPVPALPVSAAATDAAPAFSAMTRFSSNSNAIAETISCNDTTIDLQAAGFKKIKCYPDWKTKPPKKPKAEMLIFVARKD